MRFPKDGAASSRRCIGIGNAAIYLHHAANEGTTLIDPPTFMSRIGNESVLLERLSA